MTVADLKVFYDYSWWANKHLFRVLSQLPAADFTKTVAGSYGSIRNTLVHVLSAEWGWLDRCGGPQRGPSLKADDFPDLVSVTQTWGKVEGHARQFLNELKDDDLNRVVEFKIGSGDPRSMGIGELLHHSIVHAAHHRGQIALLLRLLGHTPGNFDILFYYAEKAGVSSRS
jgi:uncharacterized damage-inducible protein DinB